MTMGSLNATLTLKGASGTNYQFAVYTSDTVWNANVACVYYMSKRDNTGTHTKIYVGETGDMKTRHVDHHKQECFDRHGCNAISILQEGNGQRRVQIETDLIKALDPPCNG
jgi:predicted GIY-YIG superfamily endonuclease